MHVNKSWRLRNPILCFSISYFFFLSSEQSNHVLYNSIEKGNVYETNIQKTPVVYNNVLQIDDKKTFALLFN